jgi:hypothetical protein
MILLLKKWLLISFFIFFIAHCNSMILMVFAQETNNSIYVNKTRINLSDSIGGETTAQLFFSTNLSVIEKKGDWIKVKLTGWIPTNGVVTEKDDLQKVLQTISITLNISSTNQNEDRDINGIVVNTDLKTHKVLVYVKTNDWYKQPFCDDRGNHEINTDGTWSTWVRPGRIYAYVVAMDYNPPCQLSVPLRVDERRVFAKIVER